MAKIQPGERRNPQGRPKGRHKQLPYEAVLGELVTVREPGGRSYQLTAEEAFLRQLQSKAQAGDVSVSMLLHDAQENAESEATKLNPQRVKAIIRRFVSTETVNPALLSLRMARKLDRYSERARMVLEPWLVEAALARLEDRRLSLDEQRTVFEATRTPHKVNWPDWWEVKG